ncbi:hypothetical protein, partial [Acinetobacter venetianus]
LKKKEKLIGITFNYTEDQELAIKSVFDEFVYINNFSPPITFIGSPLISLQNLPLKILLLNLSFQL